MDKLRRSNPAFFAKKAGLLRRFAPLSKRFAFVAGNDDVGRISFILKMLYIGQQRMSC